MAVRAFDIEQRQPVLDGRPFGAAGAYEKIVGTLRLAVDPFHHLHEAITDLALAPRDATGRVEASADFYLLRPREATRGNRALLLDLPNRGRKMTLALFNSAVRVPDPVAPEDFGNGFLLRHGYTLAWVGWQHDVPRRDGMMALTAPVLRPAGTPIVGLVRCQFRPVARVPVLPLADRYHVPQPTVDLDDPDATLTGREHGGAPGAAIPRQQWRFAREEEGRLVPDRSHVWLEGGFAPGRIYELIYRSQDPPVVGLGLLAARDAASWLRFGGGADANPCAGEIDRAHAFGVSQSGRLLRHLLHLGLNEDEAGRQVFDGVMVHVAGARRGEFNMRFGQPSLSARESVGSCFPFTDAEQDDPATGQRDGLLSRLVASGRLPRVMSINSAAEYWRGDGSLVHTDVEGRSDAEPPAHTRVYLFAGTQHLPGTLPPPLADPNTGARGRHPFNVVDYAPLLRAALVSLDQWVAGGTPPPPSAVPRLDDGTAVPHELAAPVLEALPGIRFPDRIDRPVRLDFGPESSRGVVEYPPKVGAPYGTFVSAVDADGNEVAGIRPVELLVPLATYTGWNLRHPEQGAPGDLMPMMGSTAPLARTPAERAAGRDPRPSIAERYPSRAAYLARVRLAAEDLVRQRHVLGEDVEDMVARAGSLWDLIQRGLTDPLAGAGPRDRP